MKLSEILSNSNSSFFKENSQFFSIRGTRAFEPVVDCLYKYQNITGQDVVDLIHASLLNNIIEIGTNTNCNFNGLVYLYVCNNDIVDCLLTVLLDSLEKHISECIIKGNSYVGSRQFAVESINGHTIDAVCRYLSVFRLGKSVRIYTRKKDLINDLIKDDFNSEAASQMHSSMLFAQEIVGKQAHLERAISLKDIVYFQDILAGQPYYTQKLYSHIILGKKTAFRGSLSYLNLDLYTALLKEFDL